MPRHRGSAIAGLLDSGAFSDLTLVCKGRQFYVHKNIVCSQSPVINAAINGRFVEARTNTIEVDFDPDVLQCMLDYMYKGSYAATPRSPADESQQDESGNEPARVTTTDTLLHLVRVNGIADYYGVTGLAESSTSKIYTTLRADWSTDAFCKLLEEFRNLTGDRAVSQLLARIACEKIFDLMDKDLFSEGRIANDMAAEVLKNCFKKFNDCRAERDALQTRLRDEVQAEKDKREALEYELNIKLQQERDLHNSIKETLRAGKHVARMRCIELEHNLNDIAVILGTGSCCSCGSAFGGEVDLPSQNPQHEWLVRCKFCGCRHKYDPVRGSVHPA
ncbi:hypothetical protein F5Y07DRAFT_407493 [Xylaria sp. FL0933]|nr:hypothetical protein F5Y07DRAFT_407493 [Xylaria sp. FL0933]